MLRHSPAQQEMKLNRDPLQKMYKNLLIHNFLEFYWVGGEPNICERYLEFLILHVTTTPGDGHMIRNVPRNGKKTSWKNPWENTKNNLSNGKSLRKSEESKWKHSQIQQVRDFSEAAFIPGVLLTLQPWPQRGEAKKNLCDSKDQILRS